MFTLRDLGGIIKNLFSTVFGHFLTQISGYGGP
jgi:hypothetical protein